MHIAMIGTRGVPASYGGFETAAEEIGRRLVANGHTVTVYCRGAERPRPASYLGMQLVHLPKLRKRCLETISHTALSVLHHRLRGSADVAIVFNAANSMFVPVLQWRGIPVATHVDGLEWRRGKWGLRGQNYYRWAESFAVRWSDALIADAEGISTYYRDEFGAHTDQIAYGAPILDDVPTDKIAELGLQPGGYHLVVARFEPENHVDLAIKGYLAADPTLPLVIVGSVPYPSEHVREIERLAASDSRVRLLGGVWDQDQLDQLYAHSATYIHGHSVGGTNPSLLRAMGAAAPVLAYEVSFNEEVLGDEGRYFSSPSQLATLILAAERDPKQRRRRGLALQSRARTTYTWEQVAKEYELMCEDLLRGRSQRRMFSGARRPDSPWNRERPAVEPTAQQAVPPRSSMSAHAGDDYAETADSSDSAYSATG